MPPMMINDFSGKSLFLECLNEDGDTVSVATGFIVEKDEALYLITNWHVVTGVNIFNRSILGPAPQKIRIHHHTRNQLGNWTPVDVFLLNNDGSKKWRELDNIDVIALPIERTDNIDVYPIDLSLRDTDIALLPSEPVSIIGFPYGRSSFGKFAIWKIGHLASDLDINYNNKPIFLVDTTTKKGMSGSPVFAARIGTIRGANGTSFGGSNMALRFLGIYSGRLQDEDIEETNQDYNLGIVWKSEIIDQLLP